MTSPQLSSSESSSQQLYEIDVVAWADRMAELLRAKRFDEIDLVNLIEEVEDLGNRHRDALSSHLTVLLMHLLKWQYQPTQQSSSWSGSIKNARKQIRRLIRKYPSLKNYLFQCLPESYQDAVEDAIDETGLDDSTFPKDCLYSIEQILDSEFLPK
ncbi:DUF29 domain-containing protein [Acaryochloris sp. IP29b_bin.148]|uniref:DUF29 domain-containing protein n=1 Tax=Acaryochloris sp. IP29b_bin.148 TaxID=2969218 RepID=UPI00260551A0|nr:DUF29 domain-containing protein [Acaryochloris sp. IP29b_bin.148]